MTHIVLATASSQISSDVEANGRQIRDLMVRAKNEGARLIHFPEGALSGYAKSEVQAWAEVDWESIRSEMGLIAGLAKQLGLWIVLGCGHRLSAPHLPHNSLYVISDTGDIIDRYDKRYCTHTEINGWYTPGAAPVVIDVDGYRFGLALCIEVQFPEVFMEYGRLGVEGVLLSAHARDPIFHVLARGHASANNLWVSLSTPAQCIAELPPAIFGPDGSLVVAGDGNCAAPLIKATLDREDEKYEIALKKARPWRALARDGNIYAEKMVDDQRSRNKRAL